MPPASVYLSIGSELVAADPKKSIYDQLRSEASRALPLRVSIEKRGTRVIFAVNPNGVPLLAAAAMGDLSRTRISGDIRVGVFPLVFNNRGEMLFGEKNCRVPGWFPMGGQVEESESLEEAVVARLASKCHLRLSGAGEPILVYESLFVGPDRDDQNYHNVMIFHSAPTYRGDNPAVAVPGSDVLQTAWMPLVSFWRHYRARELSSMPSIEFVIRAIIEQGMRQLDVDPVLYEQHKNAQPYYNDQVMVDLTFLSKVESCDECTGVLQLVEETYAELFAAAS
jgi:ADP-ribose pyrophosphatase YjhB (NUDIX family)